MVFLLLSLLIASSFDIYCTIRDVIAVRILRRHMRVLRDESSGGNDLATVRRIAVVALYPSDESVVFSCHLMAGLRALGFGIVGVSTRTVNGAMRATLLAHVDRLVERLPVGRDFGSYRLALDLLGMLDTPAAPACEELLLVNDSMYYRADCRKLIGKMVAEPQDIVAMFENFEKSYHAQSFFLLFRRKAFDSAAFRGFWRRYQPYSSRRHSITRGEVGLSRAMLRGGFRPQAYFNSTRVRRILEEVAGAEVQYSLLDLLPVGNVSPDSFASFKTSVEELNGLTQNATPGRSANAMPGRNGNVPLRLFWLRTIRDLTHLAETRNPTHILGLLLNTHAGAPLKRDVCYRGTFDISQVVASIAGFDMAERALIEADLRKRGLPGSLSMIRMLLWSRGRV
jgi:Rhamnan synthesis protein F